MSNIENLTLPGLRIAKGHERVSASLIDAALTIPAAVIGDASYRQQGLCAGFQHYGGKRRFAGPALTVKVRPGDNLMLHKALDMAQPGDVIVCDAAGAMSTAIIGAMMATYAVTRRIAAIIIDGAVRDVDELVQMNIGMVARGATPNGPFKSGPGEIGYPINCGGVNVASGDLVASDGDGVVVIPRAEAGEVLRIARQRADAETALLAQINAGTWSRAWVDEALAKV